MFPSHTLISQSFHHFNHETFSFAIVFNRYPETNYFTRSIDGVFSSLTSYLIHVTIPFLLLCITMHVDTGSIPLVFLQINSEPIYYVCFPCKKRTITPPQ